MQIWAKEPPTSWEHNAAKSPFSRISVLAFKLTAISHHVQNWTNERPNNFHLVRKREPRTCRFLWISHSLRSTSPHHHQSGSHRCILPSCSKVSSQLCTDSLTCFLPSSYWLLFGVWESTTWHIIGWPSSSLCLCKAQCFNLARSGRIVAAEEAMSATPISICDQIARFVLINRESKVARSWTYGNLAIVATIALFIWSISTCEYNI